MRRLLRMPTEMKDLDDVAHFFRPLVMFSKRERCHVR